MPVRQIAFLLLFSLLFVLIQDSGSSPFKFRFYKYELQERQEQEDSYDDYPRTEPKMEIRPEMEPQYENQGEDCDYEKEEKETVPSKESDYPQPEQEFGSPEAPKPTRKVELEIPPASHNVIPQSGNLPVYPQWGAHEPHPEKDFHGSKKEPQDSSSEYPGITNVQGPDKLQPRSPYPGFSRRCDSYFDCDFATPYSNASSEVDGSTWFACDGRFCICELFGVSRDDSPLRVFWSKELRQCLSDESGPCGRHNGLNIYCDMGLKCKDNYCEDPRKVKPTKPSGGCNGYGGDCEEEGRTNLFSILFFPSTSFHSILNNSLTGIMEDSNS